MTSEERDLQHYEIRVRGRLGPKMLRAFPALTAHPRGEDTLLRGCLQDQAAVYGVIAKLEALGLELLELRRVPVLLATAQAQITSYRSCSVGRISISLTMTCRGRVTI